MKLLTSRKLLLWVLSMALPVIAIGSYLDVVFIGNGTFYTYFMVSAWEYAIFGCGIYIGFKFGRVGFGANARAK